MPDISDMVKVMPGNVVALSSGSPTEVSLNNTSREVVTYKLKTTRPLSVRPTKSCGVMAPGSNDKFQVNFDPSAENTPFVDGDRITVLVGVLPDKSMKPEDFWDSKAAIGAHRFVLKLNQDKGKTGPAKANVPKEQPKEKPKEHVVGESESEESTVE